MPDFDVGVQLLAIVVAHGLDEVLVMPGATAADELLDLLAMVVIDPAAAIATSEVAAFALHEVADADPGPAVVVHVAGALLGRQAAHLKDQRRRLVIEVGNLRVGGLADVVGLTATEPPANAEAMSGQTRIAQRPASDVHLVGTLVADVAAPGVPHPVPNVVQLGAMQWHHVGRAAPQIVVHSIRHRIGTVRSVYNAVGPGAAPFVTEAANPFDLADVAFTNPCKRRRMSLGRTLLRTDLHDAVVLAGGLHHFAAFPNLVRSGLFDVNVFTRLAGPDGRQRVPVVRRGRGDRVDVLAVEQLSHVGIAVHLDALIGKELDPPINVVLVRVTNGHVPYAGNLAEDACMIASLPSDADGGNTNLVVSAQHARGGPRQRQAGANGHRTFHKISTT